MTAADDRAALERVERLLANSDYAAKLGTQEVRRMLSAMRSALSLPDAAQAEEIAFLRQALDDQTTERQMAESYAHDMEARGAELAAQARREAIEELEPWIHHGHACGIDGSEECTCGLTQFRALAAGSKKEN